MLVADAEVLPDDLCYFFHFHLIVTGKGEREQLTGLFKPLASTGICTFDVLKKIGQRSPITSPKRLKKMVGTEKTIPSKDEEEISLPVRKAILQGKCHFVILIDDLEHDRRDNKEAVFQRYRDAVDKILAPDLQKRAAVFFLVNMLEAYFFADANAINQTFDLSGTFSDYEGDVEEIRHPKNQLKSELKKQDLTYSETDHVGDLLANLDVEKVLSRSDTCASLRTLFKWCITVLEAYPFYEDCDLSEKFCLADGILNDVTCNQ